ncbi:hypothetical protein ABT126_41645 [Streptomyces sp. NPDC002012]|uniref:hypothetical protein n=1 Tax=Streptomyces sp. NPDC002012 TaxID=3154532 RepID=UPI00331F5BC1
MKGKRYIAPTAADELRYRFDRWSVESVENRTASKRYKQQRIRALEMYMFSSRPRCRASAKRSAPQPRTSRGRTPPAGSARFRLSHPATYVAASARATAHAGALDYPGNLAEFGAACLSLRARTPSTLGSARRR